MLNYKHKGSGWLCPAWLWATQTTVTHHLFTGGFQLKHLKPRQCWMSVHFSRSQSVKSEAWGGEGGHWFHAALPSDIQRPPPCLFHVEISHLTFIFSSLQTRKQRFSYATNTFDTRHSQNYEAFFSQEISVLNIALHTSPLSRPFNFWPEASSQ